MGIESINEPGTGRTTAIFPASINEPLDIAAITPAITAITPTRAAAGTDPDFVLTVTGENFTPDCQINFGGVYTGTTLLDDGSLACGVSPAAWQSGTVDVVVYVGPLQSNAKQFIFT